jgi:tetratricopeptide (TPR) repeat protein
MSRGDTGPNVERMYRRAIELNPNYATARHWYAMFLVDAQRRYEEAEAQLRRAREIDPLSMIINVALGRVIRLRGDPAGAAAVLEKAVAVDGNFPDARTELGIDYVLQGRYAEAVEQFQKARELAREEARRRVVDAIYLAQVYTLTGRADEAQFIFGDLRARLRDGQIQHSELIAEYEEMARMYLGRGKPAEAVAALRRAVELTGSQPMSEAHLARGYALTGNRAEARRILDRLEALHRRGAFPAVVVAGLHADLGDRDAAFEWLEKALAEGRCDPQCVELHPDFGGLRSDPRYAALLSRWAPPQ